MSSSPAPRRRAVIALAGAAFAAVIGVALASAPADAAEGNVLGAGAPNAVADSYIVVLKDASLSASSVGTTAKSMTSKYNGTVGKVYGAALRGFSAKMSASAARRLAADPSVAYVQQDMIMSIDGTQSPTPSWGLDRIDQAALPLNNSYTFPDVSAVHTYTIDTGVLMNHQQFAGRTGNGFDAIDGDTNPADCHGHGTHVAGTIAGSAYGVAKTAIVHGVRVLGCTGSGSTADIVEGINWVTQNHVKPAVANMSLGGGVNTALDNAVTNSIAAGVTYAIAAGNSNANACSFSPARAPNALTAGATQSNDARSSFSNFGTCVDIFAPGTSITSAWFTSPTATNTISGTSMASPHIAGGAALILGANPTFTPAQVRAAMVGNATSGVISNVGAGSPNLLLRVGAGGTPPPPPPPPPGTVFSDNFETATNNWVTSGNAATGAWQRGNPQGTSSGITLQVDTTPSGSNALVTGATAGASAGANDVDGGTTTVTSPSIAIPAGGTVTLSFQWYLAHLNNASAADFFRVSVVSGGTATQVFNQTGAATNRAGSYAGASVNISQFAGQTIQLRIEAADAATASLIEASVDDVVISRVA
jgi:subtilisin family serine protease